MTPTPLKTEQPPPPQGLTPGGGGARPRILGRVPYLKWIRCILRWGAAALRKIGRPAPPLRPTARRPVMAEIVPILRLQSYLIQMQRKKNKGKIYSVYQIFLY